MRTKALTLILLTLTASSTTLAAPHEIIADTGVKGGLIVHLGCTDGKLTAALAADNTCLIHALTTDPQQLETARRHIRSQGQYGRISVDLLDEKRLPYADNLVNLIVAENLCGLETDELMRVLAPGGTLAVKQNNNWKNTIKPKNKDTDEWTHYRHDASGNAVAHDKVVGPPRHLQWIAEPRHTRSHEHTPSINALVSAGGRIFYIADQAPVNSLTDSPKWSLIARDAYNGLHLWQKPFDPWFPHIVNWGATPSELQRRLVADDQRIYVTLGLHAPLSAIDAATGEILKTYERTRGADEIILHKGILLLTIKAVTDDRAAQLEEMPNSPSRNTRPSTREKPPKPSSPVSAQSATAHQYPSSPSTPKQDTCSGRNPATKQPHYDPQPSAHKTPQSSTKPVATSDASTSPQAINAGPHPQHNSEPSATEMSSASAMKQQPYSPPRTDKSSGPKRPC